MGPRGEAKDHSDKEFDFFCELHFVQRTYGPKIKKICRLVREIFDFVEMRFSVLYISKWLAGPKIRSQIEKAIKNCSTLSVFAIGRKSQVLQCFYFNDLGMTLTLTFKVKVTRPH